MVPTRPACHWFEESCQNTAAATTQVHPAPCQSRPSKVKVVERQKQRRTGSDRPAPSAALLCRASSLAPLYQNPRVRRGTGMGACPMWPNQSAHAQRPPIAMQRRAPNDLPFSLRRVPASNKLVRGLHIQGTRWRGLLLFLANSPSLRVTAAPRRERQICLVGPSRGVGFAPRAADTNPR